MANIILFHSIFGLRPSIKKQAEHLIKSGHKVFTPDLFDGKIFDNEKVATIHFKELGPAEIIKRSFLAIQNLPENLVYAGFSFGGICALRLAATRKNAKGCILFHNSTSLESLGLNEWPSNVPLQVHFAEHDVWKNEEQLNLLKNSVEKSGSIFEYYEYKIKGHLFTDFDLPDYNHEAAELLLTRIVLFLNNF